MQMMGDPHSTFAAGNVWKVLFLLEYEQVLEKRESEWLKANRIQ